MKSVTWKQYIENPYSIDMDDIQYKYEFFISQKTYFKSVNNENNIYIGITNINYIGFFEITFDEKKYIRIYFDMQYKKQCNQINNIVDFGDKQIVYHYKYVLKFVTFLKKMYKRVNGL